MKPKKTDPNHAWQVGDLCTYVYDGRGWGILYRVTKVEPIQPTQMGNFVLYNSDCLLSLQPALGVLQDIDNRKGRKRVASSACTHQSLIDLATEYSKFGLFIAEEAKKKGTDDGAATDSQSP